jgi:hypothetical protein
MRVTPLLLVLALSLVVAAAATAAPPSALQARFDLEFLGKTFATKILVAHYVTYVVQPSGKQCTQVIDTEFFPSGVINYQARRGCYALTPAGYSDFMVKGSSIPPRDVTSYVPLGGQLRVMKLDFRDDLVEFVFDETVNSYAKIKFKFGKGYQQQSYEALLDIVAKALRIESYERVAALRQGYEALKTQIAAAQTRYASQGLRANEKLKIGQELLSLLQKAAENRSAYIATGRASPEAASLVDRLGTLEEEIKKVADAARVERIEELHGKLQANTNASGRLRAILMRKSATTAAEFDERTAAMAEYRATLEERRSCYEQLEKEGEPVPAASKEALTRDRDEAETFAKGLERDQGRLKATQADADYRAMERKRVELLDAYTRSFGTPQERGALQSLISHLGRMLENRKAAAALGNPAAGGQAKQLEADIEKFRRR